MSTKITQMVGENDELTPYQLKQAEYYQSPEGLAKLDAKQKKDAQINALTQQIMGSSDTSKWRGEGKGSVQKNAEDMAKILSDIGITDVKQFGKITKTVDAEVTPQYEHTVVGYDNEGNQIVDSKIIGYTDQSGNPVDAKSVKTEYVTEGENGRTAYIAPVGKQEVFGNKITGQEVPDTYGERQYGNFFGGTYAGKGNTGYGVQFDAQGNPIFYTQGASSNDLANIMADLGPIGNIAVAAIGGPLAVAAVQAASGKPIGDIVKSAALSYLGGQAGEFVSSTPGITDVLGKAGTEAISGAAKQFVASGGKADPLQLLAGAGLSYGANTLGSEFGLDKLTPAQQKMLNTALSGAAAGMPLDKLLMNVAMTGATSKGGLFSSDPMTVKPNPDNLEDFLASIDQYKVDQNADASGPGYYDEITGKFISDELGGLQNPLDNSTGNFDPNKEWEYKLVRPGVWADADGNEIDLTYLPNSETALSGEEIMRRAGALPGGGATNIKVPTPKGSKPSTTSPDSSLAAMIAAMNGQQQTIQVPSQDPFAHIKLMQDLFGTSVDLTPTDSSDNSSSFGQKSSREDGQDEETTGEDAE